mmetsp:Transcript_37465/g.96774  ORF Transcript_37465/g.96774 Transcript_37465/m.96774 type:complete len:84 (+) Transcript_37465:621-872(+)
MPIAEKDLDNDMIYRLEYGCTEAEESVFRTLTSLSGSFNISHCVKGSPMKFRLHFFFLLPVAFRVAFKNFFSLFSSPHGEDLL